MKQQIYLVGLSYRTAGVDIRERFALTQHCAPETWAVPTAGMTGGKTAFSESFILSTCNRVEIMATGDGDISGAIIEAWASACGRPSAELIPHVYIYQNIDAVRHLFEVASSLDSMVLGEPQILGQLKDAYRKATMARATGTIINRLLHKSFSVAKRVRTETEVASSAVSISYAAVELAKRIFGNMAGYRAMLIGAGEMAELAATHLLQAGVTELLVANRTFAHAQELAGQFKGEAISFDQLIERLADVDIVVSSTGAPEPIIHARDIRLVLARRKNRPMFFIDIAVPRDVDPDVNNLDNIYLYDIDDLKEVVEENLAHRRDEADKAEILIDGEVENVVRWMRSLDLQPSIVDLFSTFDKLADEELAKTGKRLGGLDEATQAALAVMLRSYTRKIIHTPLVYMKQAHDRGDLEKLQLMRELFGLEAPSRRHRCAYRVRKNGGSGSNSGRDDTE